MMNQGGNGCAAFGNCIRNRFIAPPSHRLLGVWKVLLTILAVYTTTIDPIRACFFQTQPKRIITANYFVNVAFVIDIFLHLFFVAYLDDNTGLLVKDRRKIFCNRIKSFEVYLDFVSTFFSYVPPIPPKSSLCARSRLWFLLRLLRAWKIYDFFCWSERLTKFRYMIFYYCFRFLKISWALFFVLHCGGCLFYWIGVSSRSDKDGCIIGTKHTWLQLSSSLDLDEFPTGWTRIRYVASFYWAITTASGVGYGDLHPENLREMVFVIFFIFFVSIGVLTYLTSHISDSFDRTNKNIDHNLGAAHSFSSHLSTDLGQQMLSFLRVNAHEPQKEKMVVNILPRATRIEILLHLYRHLIEHNVYLFQEISADSIFLLVSESFIEYYQPKESIILENEVPMCFYILVEGEVALQFPNRDPYIINATGELLGEIGLLFCKRHPYSIKARRPSQLLRISRETLLEIAKTNGEDIYKILYRLILYIKSNPIIGPAVKDGVVRNPRYMLTREAVYLPLSLYGAMSALGDDTLSMICYRGSDFEDRGDLQIPNRVVSLMLRWGWHINKVDDKGRTALHGAASFKGFDGSSKCIQYLLNCGLNPNRKDFDGSLPFFMALRNANIEVSVMLLQGGANPTLPENKPMRDIELLMAIKEKVDELKELAEIGKRMEDLEEENIILKDQIEALKTVVNIIVEEQ